MEKPIVVCAVVVCAVIALAALFVVVGYNALVKARMRVRNAESQVAVQIQKRFDLVDSMHEMVKEYSQHESTVLDNTTKLRAQRSAAHTLDEKMNLADQSLKNVLAVVEDYPELKAGQHYLMLQDTLKESEQKTALARQIYNDSVTRYNMKRETFPSNLLAKLFRFAPEKLFEDTVTGGQA